MPFYGTVVDAASLAGVDAALITDAIQTAINGFIDTNIKEDGFELTENETEYYDIIRSYQSQLVLNHHPVVSIASLTDNARSSTDSTLLDSSGYVIDLKTGILQLDPANATSGVDAIASFTKGYNSVKVVSTYGFAEVPSIIDNIATLMAAKWAEVNKEQSDADGLKSVTIGDYKETFDTGFMAIKSKYDAQLISNIKKAKAIYAKGW